MLYREIMAVCSEIHTKHINTVCGQNVEFLNVKAHPLKPSGHYMYHKFNIQQFYVLPTHCIYVFCMDLRTNSDYFPAEH